jgi:coproporphyrinogen III oxidase-like Fe-S oxidoreductase
LDATPQQFSSFSRSPGTVMPQPTQLTSSAPAYQELAREIKENSCTIRGELQTRDLGSAESVYVHVPFCFHKCHYCDFYSIVDSRDRQSAML